MFRSKDYDVDDYGNKWSLSAIWKHLKRLGYDIEGTMFRCVLLCCDTVCVLMDQVTS